MAILLGAFLIVGLVPGPAMLTTHLDVTFAMVWIIVVANILAVAGSFLLLRQLARLTFVRGAILAPFLLVLITIGAYTVHNNPLDIVVMLAFGLVGWAAVRWDWPRAPMLLAFVLGDLSERNLFLSNQLYGWSWLGRPLVLALLALAVLAVIYSIRRRDLRSAA
jgi:TctA family transporter